MLLGDRDMGTTPFETDITGGPGPRTFGFRKLGFRDASVTDEVKAGALVTARLDRRPASVAPARPRPAALLPSTVPPPAPPSAPKKKFLPVDD